MNTPREAASQRLLTEEEAAEYIGMSRSFLRRSRQDGELPNRAAGPPFIRVGGRRAIRYDIADLDVWIIRHREHPCTFPNRRTGGKPVFDVEMRQANR